MKVLLQCSIGSIQCEKMNSSKKLYFYQYADTCCKPFVGGTFISFCGWIKDRKYIDGDMNGPISFPKFDGVDLKGC